MPGTCDRRGPAPRMGQGPKPGWNQKFTSREEGRVYSAQEESAGLGQRPNESGKNNPVDEKPNMQNSKNTKGVAVHILCKGITY